MRDRELLRTGESINKSVIGLNYLQFARMPATPASKPITLTSLRSPS